MAAASRAIPGLDGLRAISITCVIAAHLVDVESAPWLSEPVQGALGRLGVQIFFVISGFLITTLLQREHQAQGRISLRGFFLRRALRILPAFLTFLGVVALLCALGIVKFDAGDFWRAATFTANYGPSFRMVEVGHMWSLAAEEQFYIIWPVLLVLAGFHRCLWLAVLVAVSPFLGTVAFKAAPAVSVVFWKYFPSGADGIATGCVLALLHPRWSAQSWFRVLRDSPLHILFWALPAVTVAAAAHKTIYALLFLLTNLCVAMVIARVMDRRGTMLDAALNARGVVAIGVLSYSLYLWQELFLVSRALPVLTTFPLNLVCAGLAAAASYYLVERPVLEWRQRKFPGVSGGAGQQTRLGSPTPLRSAGSTS